MNATLNNNSAELEPGAAVLSRTSGRDFPGNHTQPEDLPARAHTGAGGETLQTPRENRRPARNRAGRNLLIAIAAALVLVGLILWQRSRAFHQLAVATSEMVIPTVSTVNPQPGPGQIEIKLPGNLMAYTEASIYARTSGYLKAWYTDLGAHVQAGQLMADIEAPDVDAQLRQARAALAQAQATLEIDQLNYNRGVFLFKTAVIDQQDFDTDRTTLDAQKAAVQADQANVQDLEVETGFQKITAPFTGVVTRRDTDVGALIDAGSNPSSASAQELFHLARTDVLRVFIYVPEVYSDMVTLDTPAWLEVAETPGEKFQGRVVHIAGALDPTTRTLQTEVDVPNPDGRLFPGAYATVHLILKLHNAPSVIPINTVLFRSQGLQVGVVDGNNIVHLKNISVGRDFGVSYEVTSGVTPSDRLVLNPSDSLADGQKVNVAPPAASR
jgi:membrane fusion protein (multidrug efflux system)